ncbi:MAG: PQQ-dependent sugar dehydrogenase [Chloroflexota bacterium]|nr:PQQ-dependent sugar dehydrogenase [Chloroflexota bacterium]
MSRLPRFSIPFLLMALLLGAVAAIACASEQERDTTEPGSATTTQQAGQQSERQATGTEDRTAEDAESATSRTQTKDDEQQGRSGVRDTGDEQEVSRSTEADSDLQESQGSSPGFSLVLRPILGGRQFHQPVEMIELPDGSLLVAEQRGYITRFVDNGGEIEQFGILDLTESITFGGEQGLLSMALDPRFADDPYIYVYYSPRGANITRLSRFRIVQGEAFVPSELVVIEVAQPYSNHNGGAVRFGPDGMLYLGLGDGGAANDPQGHGQNRETLLGTVIRIDVNDIDTSSPYRIPTDNPFLGIAGVRPEIWAYGLRNPWRMAFDPETGDLWVGDVGQNRVEEIAIVRGGENHGWNVFEGDECFRNEDDCAALADAVAPVSTYGHDEGCSVTGGMVYRGEALPHLYGAYIFGDYCSGAIWGLWPDDNSETGWIRSPIIESGGLIASFAVDSDGEVYVLVFGGPILKLAGEAR